MIMIDQVRKIFGKKLGRSRVSPAQGNTCRILCDERDIGLIVLSGDKVNVTSYHPKKNGIAYDAFMALADSGEFTNVSYEGARYGN